MNPDVTIPNLSVFKKTTTKTNYNILAMVWSSPNKNPENTKPFTVNAKVVLLILISSHTNVVCIMTLITSSHTQSSTAFDYHSQRWKIPKTLEDER